MVASPQTVYLGVVSHSNKDKQAYLGGAKLLVVVLQQGRPIHCSGEIVHNRLVKFSHTYEHPVFKMVCCWPVGHATKDKFL